tara:strand:- start:2318 stop:2560 length:243 start_codon:yes stop_codon:yes gene_type:complete
MKYIDAVATLVVSAATISASWQWNLTVQAICIHTNPDCSFKDDDLPAPTMARARYLRARFKSAVATTVVAAIILVLLKKD